MKTKIFELEIAFEHLPRKGGLPGHPGIALSDFYHFCPQRKMFVSSPAIEWRDFGQAGRTPHQFSVWVSLLGTWLARSPEGHQVGVAYLLALGGPPLLCFQNLLALFVIRLGQGLGLSGDTL